ncbi:MAG TPA: hypothetical protein VIF09_17230 [Polyangiaceae bacterium]
MSLNAYEVLASTMTVLVLLALLASAFAAGASIRRVGRPAALAVLAFVLPLVGTLAGWAAVAFVRSDAIDPGPKFLALAAGNVAHGLSQIVSCALLCVALLARRREPGRDEGGL